MSDSRNERPEHPGVVLKRELERRGMSMADLVREVPNVQLPMPSLSNIVNGRQGITERTAELLAAALPGTSPTYWLRLQVVWQERVRDGNGL